MIDSYTIHNQFREGLATYLTHDPHLAALQKLKFQYSPQWWKPLVKGEPGIYILTGGRQIGKSTSCKLFLKHCLEQKQYAPDNIFYLPCDEVYDAKELSRILRRYFDNVGDHKFLLVIDEITFVKDWDRVIKSLADEGWFRRGICILTGSDTLILKEAAMSFPGRRGDANHTDFHLYPLMFNEYITLVHGDSEPDIELLQKYFNDYLICGGYLRAINNLAEDGKVKQATIQTYQQWIRGDFLKQGKNEETLLAILNGLFRVGVSQVSYSTLTQNIGLVSKETMIDYCRLLERMDIIFNLQAYDQNKKQGFPRKDRKFHFIDPFIQNTVYMWLQEVGVINHLDYQSSLVEACVASHCKRMGNTYYFKGQGEVDIIWPYNNIVNAIEVKWANQVRANDLKMLKHFKNSIIVTKNRHNQRQDSIEAIPVAKFLYNLGRYPGETRV